MTKTKEELIQIKQEFETLITNLKDLTEDELKQVTGGSLIRSALKNEEAEEIKQTFDIFDIN